MIELPLLQPKIYSERGLTPLRQVFIICGRRTNCVYEILAELAKKYGIQIMFINNILTRKKSDKTIIYINDYHNVETKNLLQVKDMIKNKKAWIVIEYHFFPIKIEEDIIRSFEPIFGSRRKTIINVRYITRISKTN